ncbi:MAG TPA: hypothetical protein VJ600_08040 [Holophagaceae bacterium]|nr:hypothetical protein [Holophagaceae bacterium]
MDLPEDVRDLVNELGDSLVKALAEDDRCRDLAMLIQAKGYELFLVLEATKAEEASDESWSEEDQEFLQGYRISLD